MIDIAVSKLALIGVVALVVIGPERLPRVARMAGTMLGRAQRYINEVKSEVSREMELEELRKMQKDMQDAASEVERGISSNVSQLESDFSSAWTEPESGLSASLQEPSSPELKAKDFRKKKLAHNSAVPGWYKQRSRRRMRVISGAARVAKYRPAGTVRKSFH